MSKTLRDFLIICTLFLLGWLGFAIVGNFWNTDKIEIFSSENEAKLGSYIHDMVLEDYDLLENDSLQNIVDKIADRLSSTLAEDEKIDFKVYLLDASIKNAFATTDGNFYLFNGMIDLCETPEVLSAVMAHEMGHLVHRDFTNRLKKEIGIGVIMTIFTGGDAGTIAELGKSIFALSYDREQEKNADIFASETLKKAKINPNRLTQMFLKMQREIDMDYPEELNFLMTHPHLKYRIEQAANFEIEEVFEEEPIL